VKIDIILPYSIENLNLKLKGCKNVKNTEKGVYVNLMEMSIKKSVNLEISD